MSFVNITDGSVAPTPPSYTPDHDGPDTYEADEQFANVFWQWSSKTGKWVQLGCPKGMIYDPHVQPGPICVLPQDYNSGAPYVLDDASLEGR